MKRSVIVSQVRNHLGNKLVLNAYILMAMRMFASFSGFVFWALTARLMPAHDVGLASGIVAGAFLMAGLGQLGLGYGLVRHLPGSSGPVRLINTTLVAVTGVSCLLAVAFLAGLRLWSPALIVLHSSLDATITFVALTVSTALTQLLGWVFLARRSPVYTLYKNTFQSALSIVLLLALALGGGGFLAALHAYTIATIVGLLFGIAYLTPRSEPGYRFRVVLPRTFRTPFTGYSLTNYAADQFSRAASTVIPLMVVNVLGPATAAYFFIVWSIAAGLGSLDEAVSSSMFAESANEPENITEHLWHSLKLSLAIAALVAIGTLLVGRFVLAIYGPDYVVHSTLPLNIVAIALIPYALSPIYSTFLRVRDRLLGLVVISGVDVGVGIIFMYLFMLRFGLVGATIGWLASRLVMVVIMVPLWKRQSAGLHVTKEVRDERALG